MKKWKKYLKKGANFEFRVITLIFFGAFLLMILYLAIFLLFQSESFINNPYNKRIDALAEKTVRGSIYAADGTVLASTIATEEGDRRIYPFASRFAHAVGYTGHGKLGLENTANFYLLRSHENLGKRIRCAFTGEKKQGDSLFTTLSPLLQGTAYDALGDYSGAVIAMEPETGRVLALVSKPDFDPNTIEETYESIASDKERAALINRATQGRYAPGSTFKLLTTLEYVHEHPDFENYRFDCKGRFLSDGKEIHCYHNTAHGEEDLRTSFSKSCNSSYASLSLGLDIRSFRSLTEQFLFNRRILFDLPTEKSLFLLKEGAKDAEIMESAIGQGKTLATPLQMLMIASAVDTDGIAKRPYLMDHTETTEGRMVESFVPSERDSLRLLSPEDAALLQGYMRSVVTEGTGRGLMTESYEAYGKTGTAEYNAEGDSHSWFIGYAKREGKRDLAVAVVMEGAGSGSSFAVPLAKQIFDAWAYSQ